MTDIISVEGLWFNYPNGVTALRGIDLKLAEGGIAALIGQNGSGKTTLAKMMNGLLKPTKGTVKVANIDTAGKETYQLAKYVGYSFQNPTHQLYEKSVETELMAGPLNLGCSTEEAQSRAAAAVELFSLKGLEQIRPSALPFPLKKVVCIAAVYTMQPRVMMLDEPTTGQDHVGLRMIQNAVGKIRSMGITPVIISHDMRLVAESVETVVVMALGKIVRIGTPVEIFLDEETMEKAALRPPQILELSAKLDAAYPRHGGVSENVEEEVSKIERMAAGK